jgi:hypothetical protein
MVSKAIVAATLALPFVPLGALVAPCCGDWAIRLKRSDGLPPLPDSVGTLSDCSGALDCHDYVVDLEMCVFDNSFHYFTNFLRCVRSISVVDFVYYFLTVLSQYI